MDTFAQSKFKAVDECEYSYSDIKFCSKANIEKYKKAFLTQKPNFDQHYILLNIGDRLNQIYVVLDTKTGVVFTLDVEISGLQKNYKPTGKPPIVNYSVNNSYMCVMGSIFSYRDAYDNVRVCYAMQNEEYGKYKKRFWRTDIPQSIDER
ncbi:MAG: hypothetical protein RR767_08395 [Acinetobacter sp.]